MNDQPSSGKKTNFALVFLPEEGRYIHPKIRIPQSLQSALQHLCPIQNRVKSNYYRRYIIYIASSLYLCAKYLHINISCIWLVSNELEVHFRVTKVLSCLMKA